MKIKQRLKKYGEVKPRVWKRFKTLCLISLVVGGLTYVCNFTMKGVENL